MEKGFFILRKARWIVLAIGGLALANNPAPFPMEATDVVAPIYSQTSTQPVAVLRVQRIHQDFQKRGFFKIGALPLLVLSGVRVELSQTSLITNSLTSAEKWLDRIAAHKIIELQNVTFAIQGMAGAPRLEAGRVAVKPNGRWLLLNGVVFRAGTNQLSAPSGQLQSSGEQVGNLILDGSEGGQLVGNIFHE